MSGSAPRDWGGFGGIIVEAKAIHDAERNHRLTDCPRCGAVLDADRDGSLNCPLGHFSAPAGAMRPDWAAH